MKNYKILLISILFTITSATMFGQTKSYPFEIHKSGQGKQAIILIPGFACSGEVWNETISGLGENYVCYTLTMAGFAGAKPQSDITFKNWETGIADYIKDNKIANPIIIGHSMGGVLALAIASDYPDLISKIIVVDALPCLSALMNPSFASNPNNDCSAMVNQITAISDEQFYQMQKMSIPRLLADTTMLEKVVSWSVNSDRKTFAEMYCDFSNTDMREKIKTIKCPTLVLLEPYFASIKPAIEEQYKNLKNGDLRYANKGLHFIMFDDTEWYSTQLNNFLVTK